MRSSGASRRKAVAALAAIVLAGAAQAWLEAARGGIELPTLPWLLFALAGGLALLATWGQSYGVTGLRIDHPGWGWLAALLPGMALLLLAAWMRRHYGFSLTHGSLLLVWSFGVVALLAAGLAQSLLRKHALPALTAARWSGGRLLLAYGAVTLVALAMRLAYGITEHPAWVEADEAYCAIAARNLLENDPYNWFSLYMVGMPTLQLLPLMIAQQLFGSDLWGVRFGGVIMGTATAVVTFAFARRLAGDVVGLTAALLVAGAHTLVHFSRTAQIYTETPFAAVVVMWLFLRAWTGGSLLAWVAAGVALGVAAQTYQASQIMPVALLLTALGWAWAGAVDWRRAAALTMTVEIIALLLVLPVILEMIRQPELTASRPSAIYSFSERNWEAMGEKAWPTVIAHVGNSLAMFNTGTDHVPNYSANRSLVDAVTAASIPLAAACILFALRSPLGWACAVWVGTYFLFGVMLIMPPTTFHRLPAAVVFACVAAAWTVTRLLRALRDGFALRPAFVGVACIAFGLASVAANAHYYLHEFRSRRPLIHSMGFTHLACRYAQTHTVIDATILDGAEFVPRFNTYLSFECPQLKRVIVEDSRLLWNPASLTDAEKAVLIVPRQVVAAHPGAPHGYRIVRRYDDESILYPTPLPLIVYELEREPS
jgi:hypothetical protein